MREKAQMTFALAKTAAGSKIAAWSWGRTKPAPVK
jgi:hypothetical protein